MSDPTEPTGPAGPRGAPGPYGGSGPYADRGPYEDRRGPLVRLAAPAVALVTVGAAVAFVGAVDPNRPGRYPACPLLQLTGIYCPGCGGLRTAHAVAHGDLVAALGANALVVAAFLVFAAVWLRWSWAALRRRPVLSLGALSPVRPRVVHWWVLGGLVLVFSVVRNLPLGAALAP